MESMFARRWDPPGPRTHVYIVPDLAADPDLATMVAQTRQVLLGEDSVRLVEDEWLHLTVASAAGPGIEVSDVAGQLARQIRDRDIREGRLRVGAPMAARVGVVAPAHDIDGTFAALVEACEEVDGIYPTTSPPHLAHAYGIDTGDSGAMSSRLRRHVLPPHALMRIREVVVCRVTRHEAAGMYTWDAAVTIVLDEPL